MATAEAGEPHPTAGLSEIVHQRHRLGILTITSRARQADFGHLQETLGLTSGNLSTHLTVLEDAGLVRVERGYQGRRARTWVSITSAGRAALAAEITALAALVREQDPRQVTGPAGGGHERDT
jgi:DNA-binding MarR family transcriptional regulator